MVLGAYFTTKKTRQAENFTRKKTLLCENPKQLKIKNSSRDEFSRRKFEAKSPGKKAIPKKPNRLFHDHFTKKSTTSPTLQTHTLPYHRPPGESRTTREDLKFEISNFKILNEDFEIELYGMNLADGQKRQP